MSKTPNRLDVSNQFKARDISTPTKDQQLIEKTVFTHVSTIHGLINEWLKMKDKGNRVFKEFVTSNIYECQVDYYPGQVRSQMLCILDVIDQMRPILENFYRTSKKIRALAKLQPSDDPVISTWSLKKISDAVRESLDSMLREYDLKQTIVDNVAHSRDEKMIEVYISSWEFEVYLNLTSFSYLFAEVGLPSL